MADRLELQPQNSRSDCAPDNDQNRRYVDERQKVAAKIDGRADNRRPEHNANDSREIHSIPRVLASRSLLPRAPGFPVHSLIFRHITL